MARSPLFAFFSWETVPGVSRLSRNYNRLKARVAKIRSVFTPEALTLARAYATPKALSRDKTLWSLAVACAALLGVILSAVWAVAAFLHLISALSVIYMILTEVFEIRLEMQP